MKVDYGQDAPNLMRGFLIGGAVAALAAVGSAAAWPSLWTTVLTGDMLALPFAIATFDLLLSAWAVHNLSNRDARAAALGEKLRVLKPGGRLLLTDIEGRETYPDILRKLGAAEVAVTILHPTRDRMLSTLTFGSFAPFALTARATG